MARIWFAFIVCVALFPIQAFALEPTEKMLFEKNSLYQYIQVIEDTAKRERYVRNQKKEYTQGGISIDAPDKLLFEFTQIGFVSLAFMDQDPKDVLFVGLGAGAMPKYFTRRYPDAVIDIAEIDPDMLAVAQKFFFFREHDRMKAHIDDGRLFVKRSRKKYDWIVLDAYQNDYIPFHLTTLEFLAEVKSRLKPDGIVAANITSPYRNKFFDSMVMTYQKVFPNVVMFKGKRSANFFFVASASGKIKDRDSVIARARKLGIAKRFDIDLEDIASRYEPSEAYETPGAKVLTDDFAPVHLYQYQKSGAK